MKQYLIRPPRLLGVLVLMALCAVGFAQSIADAHLRRKCFLGIQLQPVSDSLAKVAGISGGILVDQVLPGGTMAALGVQPQDIVVQFNGEAVQNWEALRPKIAKTFEGDAVQVEIWRGNGKKGKRLLLKGNIVGVAREQGTERYDVLYGEAPFEGGYLRTITTMPKTPGNHTIIYFIPGYNCFSIDHMNAADPYPKLFDSLSNLGYIVYRVDKPGMGDGPSPCDCRTTAFEKELDAFEAGYQHLLQQPWAREDRVVLFGHSLGGIEAPLLATLGDYHPKAIAVYGTVFQTWYEYIIMMIRFQMPKANPDYLAFEKDMGEYIQLFYQHYVLNRPLAEIIANPTWKALLQKDFALDTEGNILYRRAEYWQEIAQHSLGDAWAKTDAHVLSIYGEADFEVFDPFSMAEIAAIVNAHHPGHGTFVSLPGTDHGMIQVGSMEKGIAMQGTPEYRAYRADHFDYRIVTQLDAWIQKIIHS